MGAQCCVGEARHSAVLGGGARHSAVLGKARHSAVVRRRTTAPC